MKEYSGNNYWAVILGGSSGIGLATAQKLAKEGMNICIVHRDFRNAMPGIKKTFEQIRREGVDLLSFNINALSPEGVVQVMQELQHILLRGGRVRLLLHCISKGNTKPILSNVDKEFTLPDDIIMSIGERFKKEISTLLKFYNSEDLVPTKSLEEEDFIITIQSMAISLHTWAVSIYHAGLFSENACIIAMSSEGNKKIWRHYTAIAAAKAALESIARALAVELAPYGIRTNVIQAGVTDTPSLRKIPGYEKILLHSLLRNPFNRLTLPEDIANAIYLLTKKEAAWINGAVIPVDGGESLK